MITLAAAAAVTVAAPPSEASGAICMRPVTEVASGYGPLENLAFDGQGRLLIAESSANGDGAILTRTAGGRRGMITANLPGPGAMVIDGSTAYVAAGNKFASGVFGAKDGSIKAVDLRTNRVRTVATGLTMPNGMARLPDGAFVVSRDLGTKTGLSRIAEGGRPGPVAPGLNSANGVAWDATNQRLIVSTTFSSTTRIATVASTRMGERRSWRTLATVPGLGVANSADDLAIDKYGSIFVALNTAGRVLRVAADGSGQCTIATRLPLVTSVRFGAGPGWNPTSLYATTMTGSIYEIHNASKH